MEQCPKCNHQLPVNLKSCFCPSCGYCLGFPEVTGTRDSFGIKNAFFDSKTGKTIDTWKKWEKAGFKDARDVFPKGSLKNEISRKVEKIKKYDSKARVHI